MKLPEEVRLEIEELAQKVETPTSLYRK